MTTHSQPQTDRTDAPPRRGRRRPGPPGRASDGPHPARQRPCAREGCSELISSSKNRYCSFLCKVVEREVVGAQRLCEALGTDTPTVPELWAEAVALSDAWSRYRGIERALFRRAQSVGVTDEQWQAIKEGSS